MAVKFTATFWPVVTAVWSCFTVVYTLASCPSSKPSDLVHLFMCCMQFSTSKLCNNYDETHIYELFLLHLTSHSKISANIRLGKS